MKAKNTRETLLRLWGYLRKQKAGLIAVTIFTAISAVLMLTGPYLIGISIDRYIIPRDYDGLVVLCFVLLGVYAARFCLFVDTNARHGSSVTAHGSRYAS